MPITLINGQSAATSLKAGAFVKQNAPGPYSSLVVYRTGAIPFWQEHTERLEQSLSARCDTSSAKAWNCEAWSLNEGSRDIGSLDLLSKVRAAAQEIKEIEGKRTDTSIIICIKEDRGALHCKIHASPIDWPNGRLQRPCEGTILFNGPRSVPLAKDSQWAHDRSSCESQLRPGAEGILSTLDGRLLEGLVTSLFVVRGDDVVQTADPISDGVLDGIMRREILRQCRIIGLDVLEKAPSLHESQCWQEAFCTNCLRLIQPVSNLQTSEGGVWQGWSRAFPTPGPITSMLYQDLQARLMDEGILE